MIVIDGVEMVDVREAAALSRRTPETIRRWVWTGRLSSVKNGNKLFVPRADIGGEERSAETASTLADWARSLPGPAATPASSASDLVLEDRESRAGR